MRENSNATYECLLPSTTIDERLHGNQMPGFWCSHDLRQQAVKTRMTNYLKAHPALVENVDYLVLQAHRPNSMGKACQFNAAESNALGRYLDFELIIIPGVIYKTTKTPNTPLEMQRSHQRNVG